MLGAVRLLPCNHRNCHSVILASSSPSNAVVPAHQFKLTNQRRLHSFRTLCECCRSLVLSEGHIDAIRGPGYCLLIGPLLSRGDALGVLQPGKRSNRFPRFFLGNAQFVKFCRLSQNSALVPKKCAKRKAV